MRHALILTLCVCAAPVFAEQIQPDALADLRADVVILGEVHDNPVHHAHQAQAVAALAPTALVFEMLTPDQAALVTEANRGDAAALAAALDWEASGWPDFAMYHPIFTAAPQAKVYGAALPRDEVRRAVGEGAAAILGSDAERFGLTAPLPAAEQAEREAEQMEAHCNAMPADLMPGMVEAQRLRDAALARAAVQAMAETGGPVAVIAGSGHARRDWGIPAALAVAAPEMSVLSVGQIEAEGAAEPDQPFDMWLVTEPTPREDPCAAFN
ncbi:ChaN family lipoprotein [Frigidibacter sp.]|uniref:ChaN family lipoprotein n=1 Tax=Frigidibacter sp. TaxID=2586418 RepID=UPI0027357910|nr:ChaN family lipoprotein [Frigidibacter sp.]MDP3339050.1 ChaN family lipoprotein [Frigidibacter sp.]